MYETFFGMEHTPFVRDIPPENCMNPMHSASPLDECPMWQTVRCLLS